LVMTMKQRLTLSAAALLFFLLLHRSDAAAQGAREGVALCLETVIPSLFPFFTAISLLLSLGAAHALERVLSPFTRLLFGMSGSAAAPLAAGLLGGYPSGAKTAAALYEEGLLTKAEAERSLAFVNNCGMAFILAYVGGAIFQSSRAGMALWLIHVLAALLTGILFTRLLPPLPPSAPVRRLKGRSPWTTALSEAISGSFAAVMNICAYVIFFHAIAALLPPGSAAGFLELVTGCAALENDRAGFITAAALLGWGGVGVHCQSAAVTNGLSLKYHLAGKAVHALLSAALAAAVTL